MKYSERQLRFKNMLLAKESLTAREAMHGLGISQSTFVRLVSSLKSEILTIGEARSRRYVLRRQIDFLPSRVKASSFPVMSVLESGELTHIANLHAVGQKSFYVESLSRDVRTLLYSDIPYWLNDLRPSGFLGKLIPKRHPELAYPEDIRFWNADCVISYWTTLGWDLIGNIIVGEVAYDLAIKNQAAIPLIVNEVERSATYSRLADDVISFGAAGSSAAGEQPKFLTTKSKGLQPVLVKFSPSGNDQVSKRRKDLLICEHLALEVLNKYQVPSSRSELIITTGRIFLELERFDRIGIKGRRGLLTLESLDAEFTGKGGTWRDISLSLKNSQIISEDLHREILWRYYFGICIGNTDMHAGNLSFYVQGEKIISIAPVYDMLPMIYAPVHGEVLKPKFESPVLPPYDKNIWQQVIVPAKMFWVKVLDDSRISSEIRNIAKEWIFYLDSIDVGSNTHLSRNEVS